MFDKLNELEVKYEALSAAVNDPAVIADNAKWREMMKEHNDLSAIIEAYRAYKNAKAAVEEAKELLNESADEELRQLAKDELKDGQEQLERLANELKILLLPKDPNDEKNVIVEIRGGAGGDEAALFAGVLFRMYGHYAEGRRWKTERLSANESELGGFQEVVFMIAGKGA
jgi:peptide chain release factor 1